MEGETITLNNTSQTSKPVHHSISILVVDDDATCLSIIAAILRKCKYEVVTVKNPIDALCTLRIRGGSFDLVVSDVHMPEMNGFELQQVITEEFKLPVVLMSADNQEGVMLKGLERGAAYFIAKPISLEDVRDLWQYAALKKINKDFIDETENNNGKSPDAKSPKEIMNPASSINEETETKRDSKRRSPSEDGDDKAEENGDSITPKRAKVVWTNALHNRFLEAIRSIGLDRAVPKKILELMKVPGLTRENVASHLQKYRIFLRRVSDASHTMEPSNGRSLTSSTFQTNYASGNNSSLLNKFCQEDSASNSQIHLGFRQSHLLLDRTNPWKPTIGNRVPLYQPTRSSFRMELNNLQSGLLSNEQTPSSFTNTRGTWQTYSPVTQAASDSANNSLSISWASKLGSSGSSYIPEYRKTVTSSANYQIESPNLNTAYVGYRLSNIEQLAHKEYQVAEASTSLEGVSGSIGELKNGNVKAATMSNSHNTNHLAQCVSPGGFAGEDQCSATLAGGIQVAGVQPLPPTACLHGSLGTGQGSDPIFSPEFDLSSVQNIYPEQSHGIDDLSSSLLNQFDIQSPVQHIGGEVKINNNFFSVEDQMDNAFPWFDGTSNQHGLGCLVDSENFGASQPQLNNILPSANERDDDDFLESLLASVPFVGDENLQEI